MASSTQPVVATGKPSYLLGMPLDIAEMIYHEAVTENKPIKPYYHSGIAKFGFYDSTPGWSATTLTAVNLVATCSQIRNSVHNDKLFYRHNQFEFCRMGDLLAYLLVIDPEKRNAIRSITLQVCPNELPTATFLMLSACQGLRKLTIDITLLPNYFNPGIGSFDDVPGYPQLTSIRGLQSLKLTYATSDTWNLPEMVIEQVRQQQITPGLITAFDQEVQRLEQRLFQRMSLPTKTPLSPRLLYRAVQMFLGNSEWRIKVDQVVHPAYVEANDTSLGSHAGVSAVVGALNTSSLAATGAIKTIPGPDNKYILETAKLWALEGWVPGHMRSLEAWELPDESTASIPIKRHQFQLFVKAIKRVVKYVTRKSASAFTVISSVGVVIKRMTLSALRTLKALLLLCIRHF